MDRENQLQLFKDFIINCTTNANSLKNYIDFKRINECLQQLFPKRKDVSILDFDNPIAFEKVVNELEGLKSYIDFNAKGKNQYSTTVSWYQRFLNAKHLFSKQKKDVLRINESLGLPLQQIFYGAPGTGKSHTVNEITKKQPKENVFRTTFHPDSDYATFVGCYKPIMKAVPQTYVVEGNEKPVMADKNNQATKDEIVYDYTPQAFVQTYTKAWTTDKPVILVIEEINRGNCAQIFGDIFQLLDRGKDNVSEYEIKPDKALENYLRDYFATFEDLDEQIKTGKIMKLPANLYIWATMNTSDQSLFPIDSAFKRRWEWKYMPINNHEDKGYQIEIGGVKYDWWGFLARINHVINDTTNSEDKKLGYFFAKAKGKTIDAEQFVGKVLFYLWNDVFKSYGFDDPIFSKGDNKKFEFSDFFMNDGNPNTDTVNLFLRKLEETIKMEGLPLEIIIDKQNETQPDSEPQEDEA